MPFRRDLSGVISQMISSYWSFREKTLGWHFGMGKFSLERYHVGGVTGKPQQRRVKWRKNSAAADGNMKSSRSIIGDDDVLGSKKFIKRR